MRKNLFSSASKLAFLGLCLLITKSGMAVPATSTFTFDPSKGNGTVTYNAAWAVTTPNNVIVQFTAQTTNDIYVQFAPAMSAPLANCVLLNIGGNGNTQTWAQNGLLGTSATIYGNRINDAIPTSSTSFWVQLSGSTSTLTYGKGAAVGTGLVGTWTLPASAVGLQYVGFGGWNAPVTYTNISITSPTKASAMPVRVGNAEFYTGDTVEIESVSNPGYFLTDAGAGSASLATSGNTQWILSRGTNNNGQKINSGTFPKFMNVATGNYLADPGTVTSAQIVSGYGAGQFWTPVDVTTNNPNDIDSIVKAFAATQYPQQYTNILYPCMSGQGSTTDATGAVQIQQLPKINTAVTNGSKVAFVSNGGVILHAQGNLVTIVSTINNDPTNMWHIKLVSSPTVFAELTVADGFNAEPGTFKRIAVGLRNNELEIWAIDQSGIPYRYDAFAGAPYQIPSLEQVNPWVKMDLGKGTPPLHDIAVSSYGDMLAIGHKGTVLKYDWAKKTWDKLPTSNGDKIRLARIYVGNGSHIYALSHDSDLYKYSVPKSGAATWTKYDIVPQAEPTKCVGAAVGLSTSKALILIGLSDNGNAYEAVSGKWEVLTGATNLVEITIGNENSIFAIDQGGLLWKLDYKSKKFAPIISSKNGKQCCGFSFISANAKGTICALDGDGGNYIKEAPTTVTTGKLTRAQAVAAGKTKAKAVTPGKKARVVAKPGVKKTASKKVVAKKVVKPAAKKTVAKKVTAKKVTPKAVTPKTAA